MIVNDITMKFLVGTPPSIYQILALEENTVWNLLIPPSLVQYDRRDSAQDGPQGLPT